MAEPINGIHIDVEEINPKDNRARVFPHTFLLDVRIQPAPMRVTYEHKMALNECADQMRSWCIEQFGLQWHTNHNPEGLWYRNNDVFRFRSHTEAMAFKLRWV